MPVSDSVRAERQRRYDAKLRAAKAVIPEGVTCYTPKSVRTGEHGMPHLQIETCPFWKWRSDWPKGQNGYCRFLKAGDATQGLDRQGRPRSTLMLWDQTKECGLNPGPDEDLPEN